MYLFNGIYNYIYIYTFGCSLLIVVSGGDVKCDVSSCPENQLLLSTGKHGKDKCVDGNNAFLFTH